MTDLSEKNLEQLRSAIGFVKQAIGFNFLLNGGSLIAIMTFLASAYDKLPPEKLNAIANSLGFFVFGLVLSSLSAIIAYLSQLNYFKEESGIGTSTFSATSLRIVLIIILFLTVGIFSIGAYKCVNAFTI